MSTQNAWPKGVIARYLTVGGATVDIIDDATDNGPAYKSATHTVRGACTGELCGATTNYGWYTCHLGEDPMDDEDFRQSVALVQAWAQTHAEKCRAMPKPDTPPTEPTAEPTRSNDGPSDYGYGPTGFLLGKVLRENGFSEDEIPGMLAAAYRDAQEADR